MNEVCAVRFHHSFSLLSPHLSRFSFIHRSTCNSNIAAAAFTGNRLGCAILTNHDSLEASVTVALLVLRSIRLLLAPLLALVQLGRV